ncbi:helix-turn-helix transcriptional regulator [Olivibacter sp. SDN3]|uniref:helix-turn-helix domain-containing protein n=1 Tax=Olivibacter sp. SDN3 TaxID=2764720 RepID=UPI0016512C0A|nr:helix-turn-helix transcriptional regulator [Olivibacter sp. SDN3]QNL48676.1 helix-turn-helix transcriptional regulator [Olivibacter sp. SDN3]
MEKGNIITSLRKERGWSQTDLATNSKVSREMIGKYERGEATSAAFDRKTVERLQDIEKLEAGEKEHMFALLDAFLAKSKLQAILK